MGSDESHFNISLTVKRQSHNVEEEGATERGLEPPSSAYQPNALPAGPHRLPPCRPSVTLHGYVRSCNRPQFWHAIYMSYHCRRQKRLKRDTLSRTSEGVKRA